MRSALTATLGAVVVAAGALAALAPAASATPTATAASRTAAGTWTVAASAVSDEVNVSAHGGTVHLADVRAHPSAQSAGGYGSATFAAHRLTGTARTLAVRTEVVDAGAGTVSTEVRGRLGRANWTTWQPVTGGRVDLGRAVDTVEQRVTITTTGTSAPAVRSVTLTPDRTVRPAAVSASAATPFSATVYATREGLVGGKTSNGHIIQSNDHFVALPSTVALDKNGAYDYQVQVCFRSKCLTEPIWDVGPWNTKDDYWDTNRANWTDLPRGKPEAAAAYYDGYNGGKDQYGRHPSNPAGIDLADGVYYDLGVTGDSLVQVTYLWTDGGQAPSGPNVVQDGDFEAGDNGPWQCTQDCGVDHGLGFSHTGANNGWARHSSGWDDIHQTVSVTANTTYRLTGWLRTSSNSDNGFFGVRTTGGTVIKEVHYVRLGSYSLLTEDVNVGANTQVVVYGGVWTDHGDIFLQIDDVSLQSL